MLGVGVAGGGALAGAEGQAVWYGIVGFGDGLDPISRMRRMSLAQMVG